MLDFQSLSLWMLVGIFLVAAAMVWAAGTRLSGYVDRIAKKTGWGHGLLGLVLLGGITSLPEVATVSTAALNDNVELAVGNIFGSVAINIVLLAVADALLHQRALTSVVAKPAPMLYGTIDIVLLTVVLAAITAGDVAIWGIGVWSASLVPLYIGLIWVISKYRDRRPWSVNEDDAGSGAVARGGGDGQSGEGRAKSDSDQEGAGLGWLIGMTAIAAVIILISGYFLTKSADQIATETGIGSSIIGFVLVGFSTSLPEISSIYAAMKLQRYSMVLGDILGTNMFNVLLFTVADVFYAGEPIFNTAGSFAILAGLAGILLTAVYLIGLVEREDRTFGRMGIPSLAVIVTYIVGIVVMYLSASSAFQQSGSSGSGSTSSSSTAQAQSSIQNYPV